MSAPTSLTATQLATTTTSASITQAIAKTEEQKLIDNLYENTFKNTKSILELSGGLKRSASSASATGRHNKQHANQQLASGDRFNASTLFYLNRNKDSDLIDNKFNELAKKIFEELKQAQFARDFFKAVDEIISEPMARSFTHLKGANHSHRQPIRRLSKYRTVASANGNRSPKQAAPFEAQQMQQQQPQPRSLPLVEELVVDRQQQQQQLQLQSHSPSSSPSPVQRQQPSRSRSSIPTSTIQSAVQSLAGTNRRPVASQQAAAATTGQLRFNYPLGKSATIADATIASQQIASNLKRQPSLRKSSSSLLHSPNGELAVSNKAPQPTVVVSAGGGGGGGKSFNNTRSAPALKVHRQTSASTNESDADNGDGDEDDDDDVDSDSDDEYSVANRASPSMNTKSPGASPMSKSKTTSDTLSSSSFISDTLDVIRPRQHQPKQHIQSPSPQVVAAPSIASPLVSSSSGAVVGVDKQRQRFNPIVRSNTISSAADRRAGPLRNSNTANRNQLVAGSDVRGAAGAGDANYLNQEPRSMILGGRDGSSLYKPHMNYSTSVLGNHRLSDDDEIIIIPTQSPSSLVSTSPDNDNQNPDEQVERFSISRTKSFWEKLSKGGDGKRASTRSTSIPNSQDASGSGPAGVGGALAGGTGAGSGKMASGRSSGQSGKSGNKIVGVRFGNSQTFDRMDSTGGSNSNYSCSSSGDENGCSGSQSHQNQTIAKLQQEMSRQNRLRQTR